MKININDSVLNLRSHLLQSKISSVELVTSCLENIDKYESQVGAFLSIYKQSALEQAQQIDKKIERSEPVGRLAGIPISIKDNICINGLTVTCASKHLEYFKPSYNATVIEKLQQEDAIIIGKTNMDEFAMGSSTENSAFHVTKNPWHLSRVPGGSSGGSAASVSSGMSLLSIGSDTGGSIRQPASFCGVVGFKPTYGRVSRNGLISFASSLDQIGPFSRYVEDVALLLQIISGKDALDGTSLADKVPNYVHECQKPLHEKLRVGIPKEYYANIDASVKKSIYQAIKNLESIGVEFYDISLPHIEYIISVYYILSSAEVSSNLSRYDGMLYGYCRDDMKSSLSESYKKNRRMSLGSEVKKRILLGTYSLKSGYYEDFYNKACQVKQMICADFIDAFKKVDLILTPTTTTLPFKLNEKTKDPIGMYLSDVCTASSSIAGLPAVSIPCGFEKQLPVGMQLIGNYLQESQVLRLAYQFQQITDWHKQFPTFIE